MKRSESSRGSRRNSTSPASAVTSLRERIDDLRTELARLEADAEKTDQATARLDEERTDAAARAKKAMRQAEKARDSLG